MVDSQRLSASHPSGVCTHLSWRITNKYQMKASNIIGLVWVKYHFGTGMILRIVSSLPFPPPHHFRSLLSIDRPDMCW